MAGPVGPQCVLKGMWGSGPRGLGCTGAVRRQDGGRAARPRSKGHAGPCPDRLLVGEGHAASESGAQSWPRLSRAPGSTFPSRARTAAALGCSRTALSPRDSIRPRGFGEGSLAQGNTEATLPNLALGKQPPREPGTWAECGQDCGQLLWGQQSSRQRPVVAPRSGRGERGGGLQCQPRGSLKTCLQSSCFRPGACQGGSPGVGDPEWNPRVRGPS